MATRYICPHCGAEDSTHCDMQTPRDINFHGYPKKNEKRAREVGCRVMHYHDLFEKNGTYQDE